MYWLFPISAGSKFSIVRGAVVPLILEEVMRLPSGATNQREEFKYSRMAMSWDWTAQIEESSEK